MRFTKPNKPFRALALLGIIFAGVLVISTNAFADVKIVEVTTIASPRQQAMLKELSPDEREAVEKSGLGKAMTSTYYAGQGKVRWDMGKLMTIIDLHARTATTFNRATHLYIIRNIDTAGPSTDYNLTVKETGRDKTILGHHTRLYQISMADDDASDNTTVEVWASPDLPRPEFLAQTGGIAGIFRNIMHNIKGMPLMMVGHMAGDFGPTTVKMTVKSIFVGRLPASIFAIPHGYRLAPPGAGIGASTLLQSIFR